MKKISMVVVACVVLVTAWATYHYWPAPEDEPGQPLTSGRSLWTASDVPQVGGIMRLKFNEKHTRVLSAAYLDSSLAALYHPIPGTVIDETLKLDNKASVSLGLKFLSQGKVGAEADITGIQSVEVNVKGERVTQWVSLSDLQIFLRKFDGRGAPTVAIHDLYESINRGGDDERRAKTVTPYWVITKVFTGDSVEYAITGSNRISVSATCGDVKSPCVVPAANLKASIDRSKDRQNVVSGAGRPIFVVIKPLTTNSQGMVRIEDDFRGPAVISD